MPQPAGRGARQEAVAGKVLRQGAHVGQGGQQCHRRGGADVCVERAGGLGDRHHQADDAVDLVLEPIAHVVASGRVRVGRTHCGGVHRVAAGSRERDGGQRADRRELKVVDQRAGGPVARRGECQRLRARPAGGDPFGGQYALGQQQAPHAVRMYGVTLTGVGQDAKRSAAPLLHESRVAAHNHAAAHVGLDDLGKGSAR